MIKTLTIDRSKWACKTNNEVRDGDSQLRDSHGFKCCLGFLGSACGIRGLTGKGGPIHVPSRLWPSAFGNAHGVIAHAANAAIKINDDEKSNYRRESRLTKLFAKAGIKLRFVGKYLEKSK